MKTIKLRKFGNSYDFTITPFNPEFEEWAKAFNKTNQKYKNTLKELAKWMTLNLLDSALEQPKATYQGKYLHDSLLKIAAAYGLKIIQIQ